jgi:glucose/arabinose dehydrogenase
MDTSCAQRWLLGLVLALFAGACEDTPSALEVSAEEQRAPETVVCATDNGGITLPAGFCATVFADLTIDGAPARARHLVVLPTGDVFVAINSPGNNQPSFGIIGLRDSDLDGRAENEVRFSPGLGGSGLAWHDEKLYFGANDRVLRFTLPVGWLQPQGGSEVVVSGLPNTGDHISKTLVVPNDSELFVNIGSASNSCQAANRQVGSQGVYPCPELPVRAGVWRFDARGTDQTQEDGERYATGLRNMVALAVNPADDELYGVQHGRDQLFEHWPQFFTVQEDAVLPAEELLRITQGSDNGWPYCYFDAVFEDRKVLAPEYGGNGQRVTGTQGVNCASHNQPLATFGAHWAPNGMAFYTGRQFPEKYWGGAFVAFHGGFDRAPLPNEGYQVAFVPFDGATADPDWETFADGFAGSTGPLPANARHRPVGVAVGPDGSLYVSDDRGGRIWRILYRGS